MAAAVSLGGVAGELRAQDVVNTVLSVHVYEADTRVPVADAIIEIVNVGRRVLADSAGRFSFRDLSPGPVSVRAWKLGYARADTTLLLPRGESNLEISLEIQPVSLLPLTVTAHRAIEGSAVERALFDREAIPGVVGISGREIRNIPALAEPDVLRSLQAFPGVVMLNDLSAQLHVRGGGPDQNLFIFDGARVFAPYHLFGMFGAFNADAIDRVEFFRSALPARYGGALSSVVVLEQRNASGARTEFDGGVSLLGARFATRGSLPLANATWNLAGRRSHDEAIRALTDDLPYNFFDLQGGLAFRPSPRNQVKASFFASSDQFRMLYGVGDFGSTNEDLESRWQNTAGSLRWTYRGAGAWTAAVTTWGSGYDGDLLIGDGSAARPTSNRVRTGGVRGEVSRRGRTRGMRVGGDLEIGQLALTGSDSVGGYFQGELRTEYVLPAFYVEAEQWFGPVRVMPGFRAVYDARAADLLLEPRIGARVHFSSDLALTIGAGRTHQILSALRDDRYVLPGAPLWLIHPDYAPASRTDGLSAALEGWFARQYSFTVSGYGRRFEDVPRWTPFGARDLSGLAFDDGQAVGVEASVRKHNGVFTGWVGYGFGRVLMTETATDRDYFAAWDRRHSVDAAAFVRPWPRVSLSARLVYGSGLPFWAFAGHVTKVRMSPWHGRVDTYNDHFPVWAEQQSRYPEYFRADVGARYRFRLWGADVEPFLSIQNVSARPNVLYYRLASDPASREPLLYPEIPFPFTTIPSLGLDVHF